MLIVSCVLWVSLTAHFFSLENLLSSCRFNDLLLWTLVFSSPHRFSLAFKSELFTSQSVTFTLVFWRLFFTRRTYVLLEDPGLLVTAWGFLFLLIHNSFHLDKIPSSTHTLKHPLCVILIILIISLSFQALKAILTPESLMVLDFRGLGLERWLVLELAPQLASQTHTLPFEFRALEAILQHKVKPIRPDRVLV